MVLTHLILNDMIKIRGQVSDIAVCLEDEVPRIRDLAKLFFNELSKRGNSPIYNILPDTIGQLSRHATLSEEGFQNITKYLFGFISKDKHTESLVEKLCQRFDRVVDMKLCRDLSFCLSLLPVNEKSFKKLAESFKFYADKLGDSIISEQFFGLLAKAKKIGKPEIKEALDEWEGRLMSAREGMVDDLNATSKAAALGKRRGGRAKKESAAVEEDGDSGAVGDVEPKEKGKGGKKKAATKKKRRVVESSSEEEDEISDDESLAYDLDAENVKPNKAPVAKAAAKGTGRGGRRSVKSNDD